MKKPKARPLLLAAAGAVTLVMSGCGVIGGSGNLMAVSCDMDPAACAEPQDMSVPDLEKPADLKPAPDLAEKD